jgi:beta-fructofuranosidase
VHWRSDGIAARPGGRTWTGSMWECPQLFPLDGSWVLLVSVWDTDRLHHVAYALGDYDGRRFQPRTWGRLGTGPHYATSTFVDADGNRCAISWIRGYTDGNRAGALTLPWRLRVDGDELTIEPHPAGGRDGPITEVFGGGTVNLTVDDRHRGEDQS